MAPMGDSATESHALECAAIKILFHQQAFRKCIHACRGLLKVQGAELDQHPLHKSFVLFYLALCHDEIARVMHHASVSKIPAFDSAEQFYLDALASLPTPEECPSLLETRAQFVPEDPFMDEDIHSRHDSTSSFGEEDSLDERDARFTAPHLAFFSPPRLSRYSVASVASIQTSNADNDDLESHDSFSQIMTPSRLSKRNSFKPSTPDAVPAWKTPYSMPRDFSRMSLIQPATPPLFQGIPRENSRMSLMDFSQHTRPTPHSLMQPIRLGSPPKPYSPPTYQPYAAKPKRLSCKIPQRTRLAVPEATTPRSATPEPVSPMTASPVRWSPVSDISVDSFTTQGRIDTPLLFEPEGTISDQALLRLADHVAAMRIQLKTHVMLVQHAKRELERQTADKAAARHAPTERKSLFTAPTRKPVAGTSPMGHGKGAQLQKARSFWSFVPEDAKKAELQRRIQAGRERKWTRKRFSPERYQNLCEVALDEL